MLFLEMARCITLLVALAPAMGDVVGEAAAHDESCQAGEEGHARSGRDDRVLLSVSHRTHRLLSQALALPEKSSGACAELTNHGTHFTVDVEIGTPGQTFSVVADTGSNSLIVPSCICNDGSCGNESRCFTGTNRSSTFSIDEGKGGQGPDALLITFGSGTIEAVVARDVVSLGGVKVNMSDGLLLMTDQALNIGGPFEGILGLGIPEIKNKHSEHKSDSPGANETNASVVGGSEVAVAQNIEDVLGHADDKQGLRMQRQTASSPGDAATTNAGAIIDEDFPSDIDKIVKKIIDEAVNSGIADGEASPPHSHEVDQPEGFLNQANISRFSICFNDGASGVLRLDVPPLPEGGHGSVGKMHWGIDFRGISVGDSPGAPALFCNTSASKLKKGQATACGGIPDSGTTAILGPEDQVMALLEGICDEWPRCSSNYTALTKAAESATSAATAAYGIDPFHITVPKKKQVLLDLLNDCDRWLNETGLGELPPIKLHVAGSGGTTQTLKIPGRGYVMEHSEEDVEITWGHDAYLGDIPLKVNHTGNFRTVCIPAFDTIDYNTAENGPVWLLGTPIFYEYTVGHDLSTSPPAISFTSAHEKPCGSCGAELGLVSTSSDTGSANRPRRIQGKFRRPDIDVSRPL